MLKKFFTSFRITLIGAVGLIVTGASIFLFPPNVSAVDRSVSQPFSKGETITYDIRKLKLTVGEAVLVFNGPVEVSGKKALLITFTAKGFKFLDEEEIFLDAKTFFPLLIRRNLNIFGNEEKIIEFYDSQRGKVRIVKTAKGKTSTQIIENGKRFDNIYGFIYRYRRFGQFKENEELQLHLPTRDVVFKLVERKKFEAADQEFDAYYMSSTPKKFKVWFDSSQKKIPLMIDGALGFGHTSMVMKSHSSESQR